jgi:hypothetical protein
MAPRWRKCDRIHFCQINLAIALIERPRGGSPVVKKITAEK